MADSLVIVESPAKARTIKKYLGRDFEVSASVGHIRDLPAKTLGVDIEGDFSPEYVTIEGKEEVVRNLRKAAKGKKRIYLAPDPDREGEAIAWHIASVLPENGWEVYRVLFNEITRRAVNEAIRNPGRLDRNKFESQQARRILDRLVGYQISPLLWKKVKRGLSAGRVQSVAVRLVVEREQAINAFVPREFWNLHVALEGKNPPTFAAKLIKMDGKKAEIPDEDSAKAFKKEILRESFAVSGIKRREKSKHALPPFITSTLQQEAYRKLRFPAKKTMSVAQQLYEGVEIGEAGSEGLITYMRTDSTRLAPEAISSVRGYIGENYGERYLPEKPNYYKSRKTAQQAHEAIRPTNMAYEPKAIKKHLNRNQFALYDLIWKRFLACQMTPALFDETTVEVTAGRFLFQAKGEVQRFDGWIRAYQEGQEVKEGKDFPMGGVPELEEGESLKLIDLNLKQSFTRPPARFTESSLIKTLEELGIGRPSTYAAIVSTIVDRGYVDRQGWYFHPTTLGIAVNELLVEAFPDILQTGFTAQMEENLDQVEEGGRDRVELLREFYERFSKDLESASKNMRNLKAEGQKTDVKCPKCGSSMVIRWGRNGEFLACSAYPKCKSTANFRRTDDGTVEMITDEPTDLKCEKCGSPMVLKTGRYGRFYSCSAYPKCKSIKPFTLGIDCPEPDCDGQIVERRTKKGRTFYGCSNYPKCRFASWDRPVAESCPDCGGPYLVERYSKSTDRRYLTCPKKGCKYRRDLEPAGESEAPEQ